MNDLEKYRQLKKEETQIEKKMADKIIPKELEKLYYELESIGKRKIEIQNNLQ